MQVVQNSSSYLARQGFMSRYEYPRISMSNPVSGDGVVLSDNSSHSFQYEIPAGTVINLGKSWLVADRYAPGVAASAVVFHQTGQSLVNKATFGNNSDEFMCNINHADKYVKVNRSIRTTMDECLARDKTQGDHMKNGADANPLPFSVNGRSAGTMEISTQIQSLQVGELHADNAVPAWIHTVLPLSSFVDSIIGIDKNLVFNEPMYLKFETNHLNRMMWLTTNLAHPHLGTTAIVGGTTGPSHLHNAFLYLAVETNEVLKKQVVDKMRSGGIKLSVPYPSVRLDTASTSATSFSLTLQMNKSMGKKVKSVCVAPFNGGRTGPNAMDHSNFNGHKVESLQSTLDTNNLTRQPITCYNSDLAVNPSGSWSAQSLTSGGTRSGVDYLHHKAILEGSCIPSYIDYQTNWFYCDDFAMNPMIKHDSQSVDDNDIDDGLVLTGTNKTYTVKFETPYASAGAGNYSNIIDYYSFVNYMREYVIDSNGFRRIDG